MLVGSDTLAFYQLVFVLNVSKPQRTDSLCQWLLGQWESKQGGKVESVKIQFPGGHWKKSRPETKTRSGPEKRGKSLCVTNMFYKLQPRVL